MTCNNCDEPVTVHSGGHPTTTAGLVAVQDAVAHANRHPSNNARDGDLAYVVEEPFYPDEYAHFIDLSNVDADLRYSASIQAISELARRGLVVNSVRWDPPQLHVMDPAQMHDRVTESGRRA